MGILAPVRIGGPDADVRPREDRPPLFDPFSAGKNLLSARTAPSDVALEPKPPIVSRAFVVAGTEVMLPGAYSTWIKNIRRSCTFPTQRVALAKLAEMEASPAAPPDGRPTVGILAAEPDALFPGTARNETLRTVIQKLEKLGLRPILIPARADFALPRGHRHGRAEIADRLVETSGLFGIIGLGGADVHPHIYKQRNRYANKPNYPRDRFEADVALAAMRRGLAMFGICRSHQLWNAATGGDLIQDIVEEKVSSMPRDQEEDGIPLTKAFDASPDMMVLKGARMWRLVGPRMKVNASHHQAVRTPGRGFSVAATITDPVLGIRMIQATEGPNALTVQFHPELREGSPLDDRLLEDFADRVFALL